MAEPFAALAAAIPGWIERLDSLAKQVDERQRDLARVAGESGTAAGAAPTATGAVPAAPGKSTSTQTSATAVEEKAGALPAVAAHQYRTRSMILVYYDSYVQSFFEDLVRFLASSRNQLRKAKLAARVTQLRNSVAGMVERTDKTDKTDKTERGLEVDDSAPADDPDAMVLPPLMYKRTMALRSPAMLATGRPQYRRASGRAVNVEMTATGATAMTTGTGAGAGAGKTPDVYDTLDRTLEGVQALCEHTAHRFLRDGTCGDGVATIRKRLLETEAAAAKAAAKAANAVEEKDA